MEVDSVSIFGWIPFTICLVLCLMFSTLYVLWYRSALEGERCGMTTAVTILSMTVMLLSAALVPVDVFLVSSMKNSNGTYQDWAKQPQVRELVLRNIMHVYFGFIIIIIALAFLFLPLNFFYHATSPLADDIEDGEEAEESVCKKLLRALKYTSASIFLLVGLILLGIFLPFEGTPPNSDDIDERIEFAWQAFQANEGVDLVVFLLNAVSIVGMFLIIVYTGYGMSSWPCGLIGGSPGVHSELDQIERQIASNEEQIDRLNSQDAGSLNTFEREQLDRLEKELRLLARAKHNLEQVTRSFINRVFLCFRPFQVVIGLFFSLLGLLIFTSILLTSVDKAMHSDARSGYVLKNGTLPNPVDIVLVFAQAAFPLDYVLYSGIVLFFVFSSMSGVKKIGIRFLWLPLYNIKAHSTRPQALALMALTLLLILLALNVILFSIVPDYTTYGSQKFVVNITTTNSTQVEHCDDAHAPPDECNMTRISVLLLSFHSKVWIFGAAYYWLTWVFLVVIFGGSIVAMYQCHKMRQGTHVFADDEDGLLEDPETL